MQTHTVTVTSSNGPAASASDSPLNILIGGNSSLTAAGGRTYSWNNEEMGAAISVSPTTTTVYCVTVTMDCSGVNYFIPNAFSPHYDVEKDLFKINPENYGCVKEMKLKKCNRWEEKVFETSDPLNGWDGYYK